MAPANTPAFEATASIHAVTTARFALAHNCVAALLLVYGRLAQLVARFLHTEEAVGSSPASPTNKLRRWCSPAPQLLSSGTYPAQLRLVLPHDLSQALFAGFTGYLLSEFFLFLAAVGGAALTRLGVLHHVAQRLV